MSPTYTSSITREYRLLDPVLANLLNDPTELWFQRHSKENIFSVHQFLAKLILLIASFPFELQI